MHPSHFGNLIDSHQVLNWREGSRFAESEDIWPQRFPAMRGGKDI